MLRHPEISLRQPEATSVARSSGFNNEAVGRYFTLLEKIIDEHKLTAMRMYGRVRHFSGTKVLSEGYRPKRQTSDQAPSVISTPQSYVATTSHNTIRPTTRDLLSKRGCQRS